MFKKIHLTDFMVCYDSYATYISYVEYNLYIYIYMCEALFQNTIYELYIGIAS